MYSENSARWDPIVLWFKICQYLEQTAHRNKDRAILDFNPWGRFYVPLDGIHELTFQIWSFFLNGQKEKFYLEKRFGSYWSHMMFRTNFAML